MTEKPKSSNIELSKYPETAVLTNGEIVAVDPTQPLKDASEFSTSGADSTNDVSEVLELNVGADVFCVVDMGEFKPDEYAKRRRLIKVFNNGEDDNNMIWSDADTRYLVLQRLSRVNARTGDKEFYFSGTNMKALREGNPVVLGKKHHEDRFAYGDTVEDDHSELSIVEGAIVVRSLAENDSTMVTANEMSDPTTEEDVDITVPNPNRLRTADDTDLEISVPEAALHAREVIAKQAEDVANGKGIVHEVSFSPATSNIAETETLADNHEAPKSPEELIREACGSPSSLFEAINNPDTPPEIKTEVSKLVGAYRETKMAQAVQNIWSEEIAPKLSRLAGEGLADFEKGIREVRERIESECRALQNAVNALQDVRSGRAEDYDQAVRQILQISDEFGSMLSDKRRIQGLNDMIGAERMAAIQALWAEEDITGLRNKYARDFSPTDIDELESIYDAHGVSILQGLEGIRAATEQITATNEAQVPNWRKRRDVLENTISAISRLNHTDPLEEKSPDRLRFMNNLAMIQEASRSVLNKINYDGILPANGIKVLIEKINETVSGSSQLLASYSSVDALINAVKQTAAESS